MTTKTSDPIASAKQKSGEQVASVEECAAVLLRTVQQIRQEHGLAANEEASLYVTDVPIVHSTLAEYRDEIMEKANLVDIVPVNVKAGNPMPEALPQVECQIGDESVTVALERQGD
ncbi:MAG: hypothetical protein R3C14_47755 [Caldilineaceae bacterium]